MWSKIGVGDTREESQLRCEIYLEFGLPRSEDDLNDVNLR